MQELLIEKFKTLIKQIRMKMSTFDAYFSKGLELYDKNKYVLAVEFFKIALSQKNAQSYANYNLALTYQKLKNDDKALEYYKKFLQDYPTDQSGLYNVALIHYKKKEYQEASEYFSKSFEIKQDAENVKALVKAYLHLGKIQKALDVAEFIFNSDCDKNYAYIIAQVFETKHYLISDMTFIEHALHIYLRLLEIRPNHFDAALAASLAYSKMGDWINAIEYCTIALTINPKSYEANNQMGLVFYCSEDMDNCIDFYERAFKINSKTDYKIYSNLAYAYEKVGKEEEAIKLFKDMLTKFMDFPAKAEIRKHVRQLMEKVSAN